MEHVCRVARYQPLTERIDGQHYQLLAHIEHHIVPEFERARDLTTASGAGMDCKESVASLIAAVEAFSDCMKRDERFVRCKALVDCESFLNPSVFTMRGTGRMRTEGRMLRRAEPAADVIRSRHNPPRRGLQAADRVF